MHVVVLLICTIVAGDASAPWWHAHPHLYSPDNFVAATDGCGPMLLTHRPFPDPRFTEREDRIGRSTDTRW